jgi:hypothetical protein
MGARPILTLAPDVEAVIAQRSVSRPAVESVRDRQRGWKRRVMHIGHRAARHEAGLNGGKESPKQRQRLAGTGKSENAAHCDRVWEPMKCLSSGEPSASFLRDVSTEIEVLCFWWRGNAASCAGSRRSRSVSCSLQGNGRHPWRAVWQTIEQNSGDNLLRIRFQHGDGLGFSSDRLVLDRLDDRRKHPKIR